MASLKNKMQICFTKHGNEEGIKVHFGQGLEFWSCQRGADLFDFDLLLEYFIPNIELDQITYSIARCWEQELYRMLSHCEHQHAAEKALLNFCQRISLKHGKKTTFSNLNSLLVDRPLTQANKNIAEKIAYLDPAFEFSWKKSWHSARTEVSA